MSRFALPLSLLLLTACVATPTATPVQETGGVSRETLERRFLDSCIYRQFAGSTVDRARMVEDCRCASRKAMSSLEGDGFAETRSGGLTGGQVKVLDEAIAACFRR